MTQLRRAGATDIANRYAGAALIRRRFRGETMVWEHPDYPTLDFLGGVLPSTASVPSAGKYEVTYARSGTAWRWVAGSPLPLLESIAADTPRFSVCPPGARPEQTGQPMGVLFEPGRQNILPYGRADATGWTSSNVTVGATTGVDGASNAARTLTASADNALHYLTTPPASQVAQWCWTPWIKRITGLGQVFLTLQSGIEYDISAALANFYIGLGSRQPAWARVYLAIPGIGPWYGDINTCDRIGFRIAESGDAIAVDAMQLEAGRLPTSEILNPGATLNTRSADRLLLDINVGGTPTRYLLDADDWEADASVGALLWRIRQERHISRILIQPNGSDWDVDLQTPPENRVNMGWHDGCPSPVIYDVTEPEGIAQRTQIYPVGYLSEAATFDNQPALYTDIYPVADYGWVGDGSTDNATAAVATNAYMAARPTERFRLHFDASGHYCYSNNKWLNNVKHVEVYGNGSQFECTKSSESWGGNKQTLFVRDLYDVSDPTLPITGSPSAGCISGADQSRFETVVVGERTLQLIAQVGSEPNAVAEDFAPGDYVFLWGTDRQFGGWPPNMRCFEWNYVESIDASAQTVTLVNPVKYPYNQDEPSSSSWLDVYYGAARIFKLDRPLTVYSRFVGLYDITFTQNRNYPAEHPVLQIPADVLDVDNLDVSAGYLWLGQNRIANIRNSTFGLSDIDKLGGEVNIDGCTFLSGAGPASGIHRLTIENSEVTGTIQLCAERNIISSNTVTTTSSYGGIVVSSVVGNEYFEAVGNDIISSNGTLLQVVNDDVLQTLTADYTDTSGVIIVDDDTTGKKAVELLRVGQLIYRGADAAYVTAQTYASSKWYIATTFASVTAGDSFYYKIGPNYLIAGNTTNRDEYLMPAVRDFSRLYSSGKIQFIVPMTAAAPDGYIFLDVTKVRAECLVASGNIDGTHTNPLVQVVLKNVAGANIVNIKCDVRNAGDYAETANSGDSHGTYSTISTSLGGSPVYAKSYQLPIYSKVGTNEIYGSPSGFPQVLVTIEGTPPL